MESFTELRKITDANVRSVNKGITTSDFSYEYPEDLKKTILAYMKKQNVFSYTTAPVIDVYTGEKVVDYDNGITDGEFYWHESTVYYFEKYNLKLKEEFIEYAKKAT